MANVIQKNSIWGSPNNRVTRGHLVFVCLETAIVSKENKNQGINVIWTYCVHP